jgi:hypothetical protein
MDEIALKMEIRILTGKIDDTKEKWTSHHDNALDALDKAYAHIQKAIEAYIIRNTEN